MFRETLGDFLVPPTRLERFERAEGLKWQAPLGPGLLQGGNMNGELALAHRPRPGLDDSSPERVSLGVVVAGRAPTSCISHRDTDNGKIRILDLSSEYSVEYLGPVRTLSYEIDCARIGISMNVLRQAVRSGSHSPLATLFRRHLISVATASRSLSPEAEAALGVATASLARALILSVSPRDGSRREAAADTLTLRIEDYVALHLGDTDLTPTGIAAAHNISVRHLYTLLAQMGETPSDWIMTQRLAAARDDLSRSGEAVFTVAQRWGFKDHSHFTRRFKAMYGVTPRQHVDATRERS
jgi:AraC-like DNA-binding protein